MNKDNKETMRKILRKIGPFLKGSVSTIYKKCGKNCSTCRKRGGHPATYFCYRRGGKTLVVHRSEKNLVKIVKFKEGDSLQVDSVKEIGILKEEK